MGNVRLGLIGYGAIGRAIVSHLAAENRSGDVVAILVRPGTARDDGLPLFDDVTQFLAAGPDVVIEAAGHEALTLFGPTTLQAGIDLVIASVGALVDPQTTAALQASTCGGGRAIIPSGAIAGLDGLAAARIAGLRSVSYISKKPPAAWRGTAAERSTDLDHAEDEVVVFDGSARSAAAQYPKNANVSAAIAFAGLGLDDTKVQLVSSRRVDGPLGIIEASGDFGWFRFEIFASAFPDNPKSSMLTAFSLLQCARMGVGIPLTEMRS